jgi:ribonuclease G
MSKELIVSVNGREKKIAIVEDDVVTEFYVERGDENQGIVGNIYKGRVMKVLPGMQSAFVDIGLERDSFLYVSDFFDDDEFDEPIVEERKETTRQASRQERARQPREVARGGIKVAPDADEEREAELQVAALRHIEEIAAETSAEEELIEPELEHELDEAEGVVNLKSAKSSRRQRRQRRLRYSDSEATEDQPIIEKEPEEEEISVEAEDELSGRRRRRQRRRRGAERIVAEPVEEVFADIGEDEEEAEAEEYAPYIILHHEPLERITDDDVEMIEGEMLKDAILQERIAERIHEEERRASLLEVEPTPEVHAGSLHHTITRETDFERISDDPAGQDVETTKTADFYEWRQGLRERTQKDSLREHESEKDEVVHADDGPIDNLDDTGDHVDVFHREQPVEIVDPNLTRENLPDEELQDASAEIRERPRRGEFATRRGGRGRRRGFRRSSTSAVEAGADEAHVLNGDEKPEPPMPPPAPRPNDRLQRPVISDLLREGQEIIVQIAKEPIGQKGARITSHIALPGRYIVYLPTVEHVGVSRKIGTDEERQRLKRVLHQLRAESNLGGGFIVRTAANGCTMDELREDMQYLLRTWTDIRRRSERTKAPAIAHRDLDLVQRILRDQLSSDFNAIRVDNEFEYERIVDFVNRFAPKLVSRVKLYTKDSPILEQYGVQGEIDKAVKPRVWLKSGGYIVINQTEALVAIDVNTGKFVGKSNRLEDTIVKTNLEAAKEIVRQIRLRDLGGIIVLDFIDMEERRNRQKVMQALEQELRSDRSPSKILQFNDFGLVAITRKRVKQSLERTLCTPCQYCGGGGMVKSAQTICYEILADARRVSKDIDRNNEVILRVNPEVSKALRGPERDIMLEIESYLGGVVTLKSDPAVHQEQFDIAIA